MTEPDDGPRTRDVEPPMVAGVRETVRMDQLRSFHDRAYRRVAEALDRQSLAPAGPAPGIYVDSPGDAVDVARGLPDRGGVRARR